MCEVTIVIPNYKGKEYLLPCVKSLYENDRTKKRILIVDNASNDGSIEEVKKEYPEVECVLLDQNYGFCRAVNVGIKRADTPYVILLNNDTVVRENYVGYLLRAIKNAPDTFSVEPKMIQYHDQSRIDSAGTYYNALGWAFAYGKDKSVEKYNTPRKIFVACAGAAIYRREIFDKIGMFDEKHFAYLEDVDVGYRARIAGYENRYEPKAEVIHVGSAASGARYNEFKIKISSRNNVYLLYKNMPLGQKILNSPFLFLGFLAKYMFFKRKGYGNLYIEGLKEGWRMGTKADKVVFKSSNLKNYMKIQIELWINIFRRLQ